jgi:hypothetical protein
MKAGPPALASAVTSRNVVACARYDELSGSQVGWSLSGEENASSRLNVYHLRVLQSIAESLGNHFSDGGQAGDPYTSLMQTETLRICSGQSKHHRAGGVRMTA